MAAEKPAPVRVLYCGVCGLPAEYCEFGPDFERCKPWLRAHAPGVYPDDLVAGPSSSGSSRRPSLPRSAPPSLTRMMCLLGLSGRAGGAGGDRDVDKVGERLQGVGISDGSSSAAGPCPRHLVL